MEELRVKSFFMGYINTVMINVYFIRRGYEQESLFVTYNFNVIFSCFSRL